MANAIEIKNLKKMYGNKAGVLDVTFEVGEGEIFGFVGPNGAGKSTTIRTLMGLIHKTAGEVRIFGRDVACGYSPREEIGYLSSEANFYGYMTVGALLKYSADLRGRGHDRINGLAGYLELDLNKRVDDLSLGNKKKAGIILAVMHKPKLIILDEPTSGLDPVMQLKFLDIIREQNKAGAAVLLSSHILSEVQQLCRRAAIIKGGRIAASGEIGQFVNMRLKEVMLDFKDETRARSFNMEGAKNIVCENGKVCFDYDGGAADLLKEIAPLPLADFSVNPADLERVIKHYYIGHDEEPAAGNPWGGGQAQGGGI